MRTERTIRQIYPYILQILILRKQGRGGWTYEIIMQGPEIGRRKKGGLGTETGSGPAYEL